MARSTPYPSTARHPVVAPPWRWAMLGALVGLLGALLFFAPARWLAAALSSATSGQLSLMDARGTVWNGSARVRLSGGAGSRDSAELPSPVEWQLRPAFGGLGASINVPCCTTAPVKARVVRHWRGLSLAFEDSRSQWPAALLAGLGTPWNTVQAEGVLQLQTHGLLLEWFEGRMQMTGRAELQALAMSSRLSTLRPMGSYRLALTGGAAPSLELSTIEGRLQLSGSGQWVGSRLRFQGVASAAPENEASLANLLNIIGRRTGSRSIITLG